MELTASPGVAVRNRHDWWRQIKAAYVPGPQRETVEPYVRRVLEALEQLGHTVLDEPAPGLDLLLTSAGFEQAVPWRKALMFTARKRFGLDRNPTVITMLHTSRAEFDRALKRLERGLGHELPNPAAFAAEGLAPEAWRVLLEQGKRGGPILSLVRQVQGQAMCIRNVIFISEGDHLWATYFDLVGAHPVVEAVAPQDFYTDAALRLITAVSTRPVTDHEVVEPEIDRSTWERASTPAAMVRAATEFDRRGFFTEMIRIHDLVHVPALEQAVASQYSEGCFATWDPGLKALISTVTGSARPVDKGRIGEADLAVIVGVRKNGRGALVRHVAGKVNDPPSSEAVELMDMDADLPRIHLDAAFGLAGEVPVARSKLHGHRGVRSFDAARVEFVPLDPAYYDYPVSCSTDAQARAIKHTFARAQSLLNPADDRSIAFTVLPGHGLVAVEKWVPGHKPFEVLWKAMDDHSLEIDSIVPQGRHDYRIEAGRGELVEF
ncbi:MAG: hypothetical protein ACK2T2_06245 [Anaerolineales bacterium]